MLPLTASVVAFYRHTGLWEIHEFLLHLNGGIALDNTINCAKFICNLNGDFPLLNRTAPASGARCYARRQRRGTYPMKTALTFAYNSLTYLREKGDGLT